MADDLVMATIKDMPWTNIGKILFFFTSFLMVIQAVVVEQGGENLLLCSGKEYQNAIYVYRTKIKYILVKYTEI